MDLRVRTSSSNTIRFYAVLLLILLLAYSLCCCSCTPFAPAAFLGPLPASSRMWRALTHHQQMGTTTARFLLSAQHRPRLTVTAALASSAASKVKKPTAAATTTNRKTATKAKPSSAKPRAASSTTKKATTTRATASKASAAAASGEADGMKPGMKLIIVESATKANTIKRFLSSGKSNGKWEVDYCMGHVRELPRTAADMPPTAKKEKNKVLGIKIDQGYEPIWIVLPGRESVVSRLKQKAKACSELFLATDEDREGEAISWHLLDILKPTVPTHRVIFHEITAKAVMGGLDSPRPLDTDLVEAQHARRVLDRVAGYTMSPLLWKKIATGLSAGRVQSAGLKLLVDRERERMLFRSAAYAGLRAMMLVGGEGRGEGEMEARLQAVNGQRVATGTDFDPRIGTLLESKKKGGVLWLDEEGIEDVAATLAEPQTTWVVREVDTKVVTRKRPTPFTTSTLQQDANSRLGFTSSQTMKLAQELYEEGHISYMRTDSPNMGPEALAVALAQAAEQHGHIDTEPLPSKKGGSSGSGGGQDGGRKNVAGATAQEAHEAIRPSIISEGGKFRTPKEMAAGWIADKKKLDLYTLIYERTLASVMKDAKLERKTVGIEARNEREKEGGGRVPLRAELVLTGQTILTHGFLRALREDQQQQQASSSSSSSSSSTTSSTPSSGDVDSGSSSSLPLSSLGLLTPGQPLVCTGMKILPHTTSPPYRFTQGSFVRMVEELGIGRPSTYATIIEVLKTRRYLAMKGNGMVPTLLGFVVAQLLERHFPDFVDAGFTSRMEGQLDAIAKGSADRLTYLDEYYKGLTSAIELVVGTIDRKSAKRVLLPSLGDEATSGVFVGPYGPYVRDLLPGEPSDGLLLRDEAAAKSFYQDLWADDDAGFMKSTSEVRRAPVPAEYSNDPSSITPEVLESLLEMSVQGKGVVLGKDSKTGAEILLRATKYGRSLEVMEGETLHRVQVPQSVNASSCPPETAVRLLHDFPRSLGLHSSLKQEMFLNLGHYPNLRVGNMSYGLLTQSVAELLAFTSEDATNLIATGKATHFLGDHKGAAMWFVPKGRYSYPHIRWNQLKLYVKEDMLGPGGSPPSSQAAMGLVDAKGGAGVSGYGRGRGGGRGGGTGGGGREDSPAVKSTRAPSAFLLFTKDARPGLEKGLSFSEQQKALSAAWKALSEDNVDRLKYVEASEKLKAAAGSSSSNNSSSNSSGRKKSSSSSSVPRNAFQLFCSQTRPSLIKGTNVAEQARILSALWKEVDAKARAALGEKLEEMRRKEKEEMMAG